MMTIILIFLFRLLPAPGLTEVLIPAGEVIKPYEIYWEAVCQVESSGNPFAINLEEGSYGISQIRQIKLDWYNARTGSKINLEDCYSPLVSKTIFLYHCAQYNSIEIAVKAWNGSGWMTEIYWNKVKKVLDAAFY